MFSSSYQLVFLSSYELIHHQSNFRLQKKKRLNKIVLPLDILDLNLQLENFVLNDDVYG